MDLKATMLQMLEEEAAGFYDTKRKALFLIREPGQASAPGLFERVLGLGGFDPDEQKMVLAHEIGHAIVDQHFDLYRMADKSQSDDDLSLAVSAISEGDAMLVMMGATDPLEPLDPTQMDPEALDRLFRVLGFAIRMGTGPTMRGAPDVLKESLVFPYMHGPVFLLQVAGDGGWAAIDRVFRSPPLSTEQVLHPDKYTGGDVPVALTQPDLRKVVGPEWEPLGGNVLGELQIAVLLGETPGRGVGAVGWDGDRYEVFEHADGRLALAWVSTWDSDADAAEFASAWLARHREAEAGSAPESACGPTRVGHACVEVRGADAAIAVGWDLEIGQTVTGSLFKSKKRAKRW
jgi:hypothetical protein